MVIRWLIAIRETKEKRKCIRNNIPKLIKIVKAVLKVILNSKHGDKAPQSKFYVIFNKIKRMALKSVYDNFQLNKTKK